MPPCGEAGEMNRAPIILAVVFLLLPAMYVGSYCALVIPGGRSVLKDENVNEFSFNPWERVYYRAQPKRASILYWPLEQIDRRVRPNAWILDHNS